MNNSVKIKDKKMINKPIINLDQFNQTRKKI